MDKISLNEWLTIVSMFGAMQVTVLSGIWWFTNNLNKRFASIYDKIEESFEKIILKLEYHEKHDDERFGRIANSLWEIRLSNAVREVPPTKTSRRNKLRDLREASSTSDDVRVNPQRLDELYFTKRQEDPSISPSSQRTP